MSDCRWNSIEELNEEMEKRLNAIPDSGRKNFLDSGYMPEYENVKEWYFAERKKMDAKGI